MESILNVENENEHSLKTNVEKLNKKMLNPQLFMIRWKRSETKTYWGSKVETLGTKYESVLFDHEIEKR